MKTRITSVNRNGHARLGLLRSRLTPRIYGLEHGDWRQKRLTFEQLTGGSEVWAAARKAEVARAKRLILAANYPTEQIIRSIARLLARHLES